MKHNRKIASLMLFTILIMNFSTINVQALTKKSDNLIENQDIDYEYEIVEEDNYYSDSIKDIMSIMNQEESLYEEDNQEEEAVELNTNQVLEDNGIIDSNSDTKLEETKENDDTEEESNVNSTEEEQVKLEENDDDKLATDKDTDKVVSEEAEDSKQESEQSDDSSKNKIEDESNQISEDVKAEDKSDKSPEILKEAENNKSSEENEVDNDEEANVETVNELYESRAAAGYDIDILSTTSATVKQMESWAKSKGATETFISLASLYKKYSSSRGGVNWALAYVQAAKETGYGKFGGVLTEDYHNPCGLKTTEGGSDTDQLAHKKFDNWDQGIMAHLDHLALYAGASKYPKTEYVKSYNSKGLASNQTYDPRHVGNWYKENVYGKATTAIELGGKWAPSSTYGVEIFRLYCDATGTKYAKSISNLEIPTAGESVVYDSLTVKGWALSAFGIKSVEVYLDNKKVGTASYGKTRTDVSKAYPNYYNSENSGFNSTFDVSSFGTGKKTLKVVITSNDNTTQEITRDITLKMKDRMNLDTPTTSTTVNNGILSVKGWALPGAGFSYINLYIDDIKLDKPTYGIKRTDVSKVYPGYPNGSKCGFEGKIDISKIGGGTKTLKVVVGAKDGTKQIINVKFNNVLKSRAAVESPTTSTTVNNGILSVKGWALPASGFSYINLYIDDIKLAKPTYGIKRTDISNVYPNYPDGSNCGFEGKIDISKITPGNKTLKVVIGAKDGTKQIINVKFNNVLKSKAAVESPTTSTTVNNGILTVKGWALPASGFSYINLYIDDIKLAKPTYGIKRTDVSNVYPNYPNGSNCGFEGKIDISKITPGNKTLKVVIGAKDGTKQIINVKFNNVLKSKAAVESPTTTTNVTDDILTVKGWALPASGFSYINLYIDDIKLTKPTYGITRTDISNTYPGYPNGSKCGFEGKIDISKIGTGTKTIKVIIGAKDGTKQIFNIKFKHSKKSLGVIDEPVENQQVSGNTLKVRGWGLLDSGVSYINAYLDNQKLNKPKYGTTRTDVSKVYPGYSVGSKCGFEGTLDISNISEGTKTLKIILGANDGSKLILTKKVKITKKKTIYVDPGHDYGGDRGASRTINGVTYDETELTIQMAEYLRTELINMGYNVVMARRQGEKPTSPNYQTNLWNRINQANDLKADFYVSIHCNASTSTAAKGTEVYYCTDNPNNLSSSELNNKISKSKTAAAAVSAGIASAIDTNNRGIIDDSFMVVRYTNMPSILVETGFISNEAEAKKLANSSYQKKIAQAIAKGIKSTIN